MNYHLKEEEFVKSKEGGKKNKKRHCPQRNRQNHRHSMLSSRNYKMFAMM